MRDLIKSTVLHLNGESSTSEAERLNHEFNSEYIFHQLLYIEQKRSDRSKKPFLLMLLDVDELFKVPEKKKLLQDIKVSLSTCLRETDLRGWYKRNTFIGVIFTEIIRIDESVKSGLQRKVLAKLAHVLDREQLNKIRIFLHVYPEENCEIEKKNGFNPVFYPDESSKKPLGLFYSFFKRIVDIIGSTIALIIFLPFFLVIATAIKLTSQGPVLFRQERLGLHGKPFTFLKFRSMYTNIDDSPHKAYIKSYIAEQKVYKAAEKGEGQGVYKITDDPRITPVGKFIRMSSLDELPQFINVIKGDMSLVGPRPPVSYEFEIYEPWHRRRLLEVKPGITGLWQVSGRSSVAFDDMVRLDLKYITEKSLWLDLKIVMKTPWAVISGVGAY